MPTTTLNATFDGSTPVNTLTGTQSWSGSGRIEYYSEYEDDPNNDLVANVTFAGSGWRLVNLRIADESRNSIVNITDTSTMPGSRIDLLTLGWNSDVTLTNTRVQYIYGWDGASHDVTLGTQFTSAVDLFAAQNTVTTGSGYVRSIRTGEGTGEITVNGDVGQIIMDNFADTLTLNSGFVNTIDMRGGNDVVTGSGGEAGRLRMRDGNNEVTLSGTSRIEALSISNGDNDITLFGTGRIDSFGSSNSTNTVTLWANARFDSFRNDNSTNTVVVNGDSRINTFSTSESDNIIRMNGDGRVQHINTFEGSNDIRTGDRYVNSIDTFESTNTIVIGTGGVGSIRIGGDTALSHTVTTFGWMGAFQADDNSSNPNDDQTITLSIRGDAGTVNLGAGDDRVDTRAGFVDFINTGRGDDFVVLGSGSSRLVTLGDGDDIIRVNNFDSNTSGVAIHGGSGTDFLDFLNIRFTAVNFSLDAAGAYQNIGAAFGDVSLPPVVGYFAEIGIDNLRGSRRDDWLEGDDNANRLDGWSGDDTLEGGGGNDRLLGRTGADDLQGEDGNDRLYGGSESDTLTGGAGDDLLWGQAGADVFVFEAGAGDDRIVDFEDGSDIIRIADHAGGFGGLSISDLGADLSVTHDGGSILLLGLAGTTLTLADFDFV